MKIAYYDSGWPLAIGNAFLDYGSVYAIKQAVPQVDIFYASELPRWNCWFHGIDPVR